MKGLVSSLRGGLKDRPVRSAIIHARLQCEFYRIPNYVDLYHFCQLLMDAAAIQKGSALYIACGKLQETLKGRFIERVALKRGRADSFGLSIFFPKWQIGGKKRASRLEKPPLHDPFEVPDTFAKAVAKIRAAYADHEFADQSGWKQFLFEFIKARFVPHGGHARA
jgi:hypothetical protein